MDRVVLGEFGVSENQRCAASPNPALDTIWWPGGTVCLFAFMRPQPGIGSWLLTDFGSDPLYIRLCRLQESFRARLTPQPWRCRLQSLPVRFRLRRRPNRSAIAAGKLNMMRRRLLLRPGTVEPEFIELIQYHDSVTKADSGVRLA